MNTSIEITNISKAYTECVPKLNNIAKDSKGYGYNYTSLEKLIEYTKPILSEHGLSILQIPTGNGLITRLIHSSGEWFEQEMSSELIQLKGMNAFQVQGSQITYLRRYMWSSICGIASDDDMDAQGTQEKVVVAKISEAQLKKINTLMSVKKVDRDAMKAHYKIESFKDFPVAGFQAFIDYLEAMQS